MAMNAIHSSLELPNAGLKELGIFNLRKSKRAENTGLDHMAQTSTTALSALPLADPNGAVKLQTTEKNVVVANMAAELAAKRNDGAAGQVPQMQMQAAPSQQQQMQAAPPQQQMQQIQAAPQQMQQQMQAAPQQMQQMQAPQQMPPQVQRMNTSGQPVSPQQQANFARGVASAAASGALALPQRDVIGNPGAINADPAAQSLHVPRPKPGPDYIAQMEQAHRARAQAAANARAESSKKEEESAGLTGDTAIQAAIIAGVLFLISQLPATRSIAASTVPKLFSGSGGLTTIGATGLAIAFGAIYYAATLASKYMCAE